ncbi:hypothetical protein C8R46DRAFT_1361928 [Mycena filopes]|nr:hypothetical protein C8R46DRAFT_1361928 [Mycena filopes]
MRATAARALHLAPTHLCVERHTPYASRGRRKHPPSGSSSTLCADGVVTSLPSRCMPLCCRWPLLPEFFTMLDRVELARRPYAGDAALPDPALPSTLLLVPVTPLERVELAHAPIAGAVMLLEEAPRILLLSSLDTARLFLSHLPYPSTCGVGGVIAARISEVLYPIGGGGMIEHDTLLLSVGACLSAPAVGLNGCALPLSSLDFLRSCWNTSSSLGRLSLRTGVHGASAAMLLLYDAPHILLESRVHRPPEAAALGDARGA